MRRVAVSLVLAGTAACSGLHADPLVPGYGARLPTCAQAGRAALDAALHPATWAPALGAAVLTVDDLDERASGWARRHTPVFGSSASADDASTVLDGVLAAATLGTALAVEPEVASASPWRERGERLAIEALGVGVTGGLSLGFKEATDRLRPDGEDHASFPSGHTSLAFAMAGAATRNADALAVAAPVRVGVGAASYVLAGLVGWGRVEAGRHYPTDVLAGAALGHFLGVFVSEAFLGPGAGSGAPLVSVAPWTSGLAIALSWPL